VVTSHEPSIGERPAVIRACASFVLTAPAVSGRRFAAVVRHVVATALAAGLIVSACGGGGGDGDAIALPDLTLTGFADEQPVELQSLVGEPLVVNFWGSYCAPCRAEMPAFEQVHQALGDEVRFVGVNTADNDPPAAVALLAETGVTFTQLVDRRAELLTAVESSVMPSTLFVDANGDVVETHFGELTADELTAMIEQHLLTDAEPSA
jgi:thiol-disulfide isomerase/thioredoxin